MSETGHTGEPTEHRKREWREVPRPREVAFIGDLNGSYHALLKNLLHLNLVEIKDKKTAQPGDITSFNDFEFSNLAQFIENHDITWKGKDTALVFLGDILGDRNGRGDFILNTITNLKAQAEKENGKVITLAGNHDIAAMYVLMTGDSLAANMLPSDCSLEEYELFAVGIRTVQVRVGGEQQKITYSVYDKTAMFEDPRLVKHIDQICSLYDLAAVIDDTLFLHADVPEEKFIKLYQEAEEQLKASTGTVPQPEAVMSLWNSAFKTAVREAFPKNNNSIDKKMQKTEAFETLFANKNHFGSTLVGRSTRERQSNQGGYSDVFKQFLRERGLNAFVHGHSAVDSALPQDNSFLTLSADGHTNRDDITDENFSSGIIQKEGKITLSIRTMQTLYRTY